MLVLLLFFFFLILVFGGPGKPSQYPWDLCEVLDSIFPEPTASSASVGGVPVPWAHQGLEDKRGETGALGDAGEERGEEQGAQRNSIRCLEREPGQGGARWEEPEALDERLSSKTPGKCECRGRVLKGFTPEPPAWGKDSSHVTLVISCVPSGKSSKVGVP